MLIDTHAHLYWSDYKQDFDQVIQRSIDAGVTTIINVGVDVEKSKEALQQVQGKLANIPGLEAYSTIGIHPHEAIKYTQSIHLSYDRDINVQNNISKDVSELEKIYNLNLDKIVAVGECGLDYYFRGLDPSVASLPKDDNKILQRQLFQAQIDLAKKLNLPLIVHCRDDRSQNPENSEAWDEVLKMVEDHPTILHCYSGLPPTTNRILQTTHLIVSFAGTLTYPKNEYLREAVKLLPLEKIVLETDCPFLPPQSKRGTRNEPSSVLEIAQLIADIKGVSLKEVSNQTTINVKKIFNMDPETSSG
ncbi:TatD family hydrolase [Candidatus Daviesbacteria bacterium]|nr:TatD family hydrolase [Candidatus Daviesbacteria bacterium]